MTLPNSDSHDPSVALPPFASVAPPTVAYATHTTGAVFSPTGERADAAVVALYSSAVLAGLTPLLSIAFWFVGEPDQAAQPTWLTVVNLSYWLIAFVVSLGTVITFLRWLHLSYRNLRALGSGLLRYTPGWAVAYWFIPIVWWFRPYQAMRELYNKSDPTTDRYDGNPASIRGMPRWFKWYWAAWIVGEFLGDHESIRPEDVILTFIGSAITCAAALLAVRYVREVTEFQSRRVSSGL